MEPVGAPAHPSDRAAPTRRAGLAPTLPTAVRSVLDALRETASALTTRDAVRFAAGQRRLAAQDPGLLRLLAGHALRGAMEQRHPDGLDADAARDLLRGAVRNGLVWLPEVEVEALMLAVTGALGMQDPDTDPLRDTARIAAHALLLLDPLDVTAAELDGHLADAVAELARAQTQELP